VTSAASSRFIDPDFRPAYLDPTIRAALPERAAAALHELSACHVCPRGCGVNRLAGETRVCQIGRQVRVTAAFPHHGEERCLSGVRGSGTVFFSGCNLRCVFCQNADISQRAEGVELDAAALAAVMLRLQQQGCHNLNLVTPEHVVPQVLEALARAVAEGLRLPIVYNTSGYDAIPSLQRLDGLTDIYLPDFKFWSPDRARRWCKARDYPERARAALQEMHRQVGDLRFTPDGLACRGVLVRHLVMPGGVDDSRDIFRWLADTLSPDTFVNIMAQYHPAYQVGRAVDGPDRAAYAEINRPPDAGEIEAVRAAARAAGLWRFDA
jgi:putative pyruvate formate lyase activating enzyme